MRRWRYAAMAVSAALAIAGCTSTGTTPPAASGSASPSVGVSSAGIHWLIATSAITKLDDLAGPTVVARYLDGPQTTIITNRTIPDYLIDWRANFALDTKSLEQIRTDVTGTRSPRISMILYDPEHWSFTPPAEQTAVGPSTRTAASIAHGAGLGLIAAPATDLAQQKASGESSATAFLQTNDLGQVASSANWVEIQAQGLERNPAGYAAYIDEALRQIRQASPNAVVYAGLSTNPSGPPVDAAELIQDVKLTSSVVSGYWLNIPAPGSACPRCGQPQPQIAIDLLASLAPS